MTTLLKPDTSLPLKHASYGLVDDEEVHLGITKQF